MTVICLFLLKATTPLTFSANDSFRAALNPFHTMEPSDLQRISTSKQWRARPSFKQLLGEAVEQAGTASANQIRLATTTTGVG